jgi:hypothetical protein
MNGLRQVSSPMVLIPAYGRVYTTREAMLKDWEAGKDFRVVGHGCYTSIRDLAMLRESSSSVTLHEPRAHIHIKL